MNAGGILGNVGSIFSTNIPWPQGIELVCAGDSEEWNKEGTVY